MMKSEKKALDTERQDLLKARAKHELDHSELKRALDQAANSNKSSEVRLAELDDRIQHFQAELTTDVLPKFETVRAQEFKYST